MATSGHLSPLHLDIRNGWPAELRLLLERFPRETWFEHDNLGQMARFWLDIHGHFRKLGDSLKTGTARFREGDLPPDAFRAWFQPRLSYFLSGLQGHHQIEDHQFFPVFGTAEPRLLKGFDILERDHEVIHASMMQVIDAANLLLTTADTDRDGLRRTADAYADNAETLLKRLVHHLDDEEDLIIPLILDRGEAALGI